MRDVFPPPRLFPQNIFVPSFWLGVSVSGPFSRPYLSNESHLFEIFIHSTSPIFHSYLKRKTVSGTDVVFKESKSHIAQCHQARDDWRTVWGQGPVARTFILFVSMFSCYSLVQSVIYFFLGWCSYLWAPVISWACGLTFLSPLSCLFSSQHHVQECLQDPWSLISFSLHTYGSEYSPAGSFAAAFPLLRLTKRE